MQAVGTAGAREVDAAGHHQDTARVTLQVGSSSHTNPSLMALPARPHTHSEEPATHSPSLPSLLQMCGEQKVITEQQGAQQTWGQDYLHGQQHLSKGGGTGQFVTLMGQSTRVSSPKLCPKKLCHWTGQA